MKFIEAKQVPEVETVVHLVVASSDTRHSVATAADLELKSKQRLAKERDLCLVHMLFTWYKTIHSVNYNLTQHNMINYYITMLIC